MDAGSWPSSLMRLRFLVLISWPDDDVSIEAVFFGFGFGVGG